MTATLTPAHRADRTVANVAAEPDYLLRRVVAVLLLLVVLSTAVLAVGAVLASLGGDPASAAESSPADASDAAFASRPTVHVARPGDTMWSIAAAHHGEVDHGRYLDGLLRLNGGSHIEVGQAVRLP